MKNSLGIRKETLLVGILSNPNYSPSLLAATYIQKVLHGENIKTVDLSLDDIIEGNVVCDTLFNVYYGEIGDGGIVAGILDQRKNVFIGNDQRTCSLMFNKVISKMIFEQSGYLTPPFWYEPNVQKTEQDLIREIEGLIQYPLLSKPVNGAASENIHFVDNNEQLRDFILKNRTLIDGGYYFFEQFIKGRELSVGYVNAIDDMLPVIEIRLLTEEKYQSNEVKFSSGLKENIIPAKIDKNIYESAQVIARDLNSIFCCRAFSRTDIVYDEQNQKLYLLEINTNPGLLEKSLLPLMARSAGFGEAEFFLKLIGRSIEENAG